MWTVGQALDKVARLGGDFPYRAVTIANFSEHLSALGLSSPHVFGPINQLVLEKATKFTGYSMSFFSNAIAWQRWLRKGLCDKALDSNTFFDNRSGPMFFWRGDWPFRRWRNEKDVHRQAALPKRIESQTCRFVFFAGIEGTGHHVWHSLWKKLGPSAASSIPLTYALYDHWNMTGFFNTFDGEVRARSAESIKQLMISISQNHSTPNDVTMIALNVGYRDQELTGMMSYPNFMGQDRAIQNPDVHALANLAEAAGVDLRIVLMLRHPASTVRSGLRRNFEPDWLHAVKTYTLTLALLTAQLNLIDPSFIACWDYETPTAGLSDLLSSIGARQHPTDFDKVMDKEFHADSSEKDSTDTRKVREALQTAVGIYNELRGRWCFPRLHGRHG